MAEPGSGVATRGSGAPNGGIAMTRRASAGEDRAMHPAPKGYRAVELTEARSAEVLDVDSWAFAYDDPAEEAAQALAALPWDRAAGIEGPDGTLVDFHASFPLSLTDRS